jgi:hypothetical protein
MSQNPLESEQFQYSLFEYLESGEPVIHRWAKKARLSVRDRAALNNRFRKLRQVDFELAIGTLISGPIYKHVYKCVIHGDVMLRPMLCRGPHKPEKEYTLLLGAIEKDWKLPPGSEEKAEDNRNAVSQNQFLRRIHEKISLRSR